MTDVRDNERDLTEDLEVTEEEAGQVEGGRRRHRDHSVMTEQLHEGLGLSCHVKI